VLVNGQPEPNVEVHVYEPGTTNEITVYEDEGVTPITQPILTDSQGRYAFFVDVDAYPEIRLYLEKDGVDFSEANEDLDGVPVPGAGAGAGTFLELTDTPSSYVGRGGDVVLVKTTEDGIETQPWPVTGTTLNFFLSDDAADIGSYYYMYPTESGDGYSELTSPSLSTGDDQLLWSFVTEAGEPGVEVLALGAYTATLFLKKTGNKDVRVYWKLFKRDTEGTETEILQSAVSDYLTADNSQYLISAYLNEDQVLDPTDRLVLKLFANVSGTGTDVTVTLTMEGDYDSRLTINVLSSAFDLDRLSDVTIASPSNDELLAYDSGSGKWMNQTPSEAGVLAADGSVPLTGDLNANGNSINNILSWPAPGAYYNVLAFGAKGDGSSDDTLAIQAAIDAAKAAGGGIVLFPNTGNDYKITSALTVYGGVELRGGCAKGISNGTWITSRIVQATSGANAINIAGTDGSYLEQKIKITGLHLWANDSGTGSGIHAIWYRNLIIEDVTIQRFQYGIDLSEGGFTYLQHVEATDNTIGLRGVGARDPSSHLFNINIIQCQFRNNSSHGIYLEKITDLYISQCVLNSNGGDGLRLVGTSEEKVGNVRLNTVEIDSGNGYGIYGIYLENCVFENIHSCPSTTSGTGSFYFSNSSGLILTDCLASGNFSGSGVKLLTCSDCQIRGGLYYNLPAYGVDLQDCTNILVDGITTWNNDTGVKVNQDCTNIIICGNVCYDNTSKGIHVTSGALNPTTQVTIAGNVCYDSGGNNQDYGILCDGDGTEKIICTGNNCYGNVTDQINLAAVTQKIEANNATTW